MATQKFALPRNTVTRVVDAPDVSLEYGVTYLLQNQGPGGVYLSEEAVAPDVGDPAFIIPLQGVWSFTPESGAEIYIWTLGSDGLIVVSEA